MAYIPMTPQERMQRAALLRAQREARLGYTPTVTEDLSRYLIAPTEQSVGSVAPVASQPQNDVGANVIESVGKHVATVADLGANVGIGALKSLEGIFDIGASLVGTVGGWFSEDFKREVEKVVEYQAINEWMEKPLDELGLKHSYLNDSEVGEFIGGVAQGVGGMLPAVLVTVATAGAATPAALSSLGMTTSQLASLGVMAAGAAGNASEEALNDGATLGQATNYGVVSGAVEGVTEKLTGGVSKWLIGKGIIKGGSEVAAQGGKRILKNMAGEAVEEGLATLVNPLAKTTYKGADALSEYGEAEFYGDVLRDAASGALVAGAFENTVGRVAHRAGADADIYDAQEAIDNIVNKQRAEQAKGIYEHGQLDADAMQNLENISKTLKKASPEKRAKLIERHDLSQAFDESGEIKPEFAARFDGGTTTPQDGTMGATQSGQGYNRAYYSADKRGSEAQIASEVESIQESLRNVERNRLEQEGLDPSAADNITVKVFDGELSEQGEKNLANAHGFINNVSDRTSTGMSMVVVDSGGTMNGAVLQDGNTLYIDASQIEDGTYIKTMVEEVAHFSEGTESYGKLLSFIAEDEDLFDEVVGELVADSNGYGFTADTFLSLAEKSKAGDRNALTGEEKSLANEIGAHMVAETFGNETFMQKVIKGEPTLAEKMIARIKTLKNALSGNESAEARAERKRLEKAEKLWMKSVEDAGYKYVKGKLIKRRREKEEEEKKKAASSTENVQEAEEESSDEGEVQTEDFDDLQTRAHVNDAQFSLKFAPQIAETQRKYIDDNNTAVTSVELDRAIEQTQKMVDIMSKHADILPKDTVGKTLVKNGSYDVSVENTTVCVRSLAYNAFVDMVSEKIGRPLTQMESFLVSQKLYEIAREPQCLYCYVSLDRKAYNEMVIRYVEQRDAAIAAWEKAGRPNVTASSQLYKDFLGTRKPTDNMWLRYKSWIDMSKKGEKLLSLEDLSTEAKRSEMTLGTESQKSQVQDILKYAQSASWAKKQTQFVAYKDEILKLPQRTINALNKHYGLRWYSFSDYSGAFIVENMQQITDAAIRGLKGLAYTKDTDFVKIFAPTGMNINVSVYAMKDGRGGYVIDPKQSADIEEAIKLREKYPNVGIVVVATDNDGVKWALDQEWSDVVIPFHTVRTGADVAAFYDWEVFNAEQADSVEDKNLWEAYVNSVAHTDSAKKKVSKNIYPSEHQNDRETYFRILKERGLKARFSSFADHPNYMKLVNETRQSEKDTRKLTPTFALDAAEASFDKFVEKGGYYEGWYNDGIDVDGEAEIVAEDVKAGRKPDEVEYALKGVDYESMQKQRKKNRVHSGGAQFSLPNRTTDAAYLKAVEDGDMETAQRMVDEAARRWGGDALITFDTLRSTFSEVVDNETGEITRFERTYVQDDDGILDIYAPIPLYRSSDNGRTIWDKTKRGDMQEGVYLTDGKHIAEAFASSRGGRGAKIIKVYAKAENPFFIDAEGRSYTDIPIPKNAPKWLNGYDGTTDADNLPVKAFANGYDAVIIENVKEGVGGGAFTDVVMRSGNQIKSADPVTYDNKGNVIPLSKRFNVSDPDIRFSLPNKGGEAKKKAERSRSNSTQKYYLRDEISIAVDAIVAEQMNFGERHGVLDFQTKKKVVRQVWEKLNSASDDRERARIANELADYIIDSAVAQKVLSKEDSAYLASAKQLMRKLDLDGIKPQIAEKLGARTSVYAVWGKRRGGESISLADAKKMLAESGIELQATEDAEIFLEILDRYNEIKQWIRDESTTFKKSISAAELSETKKAITEDLLSFSEKNGSPANFSRMVEQYERRIDRLNSRLKEQYESARLIREVVFRADRLKKLQLGKMHNASEFNPQYFRKTIGALGSIVRGGELSVKNTREVSGKLAAWLRWHMKQIDVRLAEDEGRKFELNKIVAYLDEIADPMREGVPLSVDELKNLSYAMARLTTYASEYGKIIRNGKRIDALPIVEGYIDRSDKTRKIPRGAIRTLREWYIGKFADPATVMRYADGYDEHGFFTETFNEFREGAIKVEVTRMELMEDYVKFLDKHKKYSDHLREYVEYRGKRVPRNVLISLWMTTKRKQAQLGLVMEGAQFRAEPDTKAAKKTDDGTRVFDIAPFGDPMRDTKTDPYTDEEIETIMEGIRTEIEKSFTDTDRSYIAMVEGIFKECGEIKRSVDMERLGYTNVDEKQYYFPIARADIAQTIEQESWQQGLDRVSHLSMNKDTVKGAHNRLYLSGVDAILARHVNQVSLYNGIATAVDNFNLLVNLKINEGGAAITVNNTVSRTDYGKAALDYLKKLKSDIERVNRVDLDDAGVTKFLAGLRGVYATSTLGANPKVWVTQASSLIAAGNVLDGKSIAEGMALKMGKVNGEDEVDIYCPLAKLRNDTNTAYEAQSVSAKRIGKVSDFLMKPIGAVDRFVIERLWGACQVQVHSKGGAKVGTKENKVEAGKLLQKVILETQQNSLATERSSAMRSTNEVVKSLTMFSADAMKMIGRFFDAYGEASFIRQRLKDQTLSKTEREKLEARKKVVDKHVAKSISVLLSSAIFMAAIAAAFKALLGQYEEKEPEEVALDMTADGVGNLLSGLPLARDVYSYFADGFELNMHLLTPVNGLLDATKDIMTLASDGASGKNVTSQQIASATRKGFFAGGQILGLPTKNVYKYATSVISLVSPETGYAIDSAFTKPSIKADLKKAIEAGDTKMVARIAEIATSENYGMYSESTRKSLRKLVEAGYTVFPRTVGDTVTVDGETYELTDAQKKQFAKVYAVSDKAVEELVSLKQYKSATDEVKAKALKYVYDTYYSVALDDLMGTDTTQKSVLFAEVIDVELLAMIVAHVSTLAADKDKDGKTVNGSRKHKIVAYVNSLNLSAAEKYMIMGYLGYTNVNGKNQVESLINRSSLSRTEKATLLAYSGY